jgi:diguanylate cyclase
VLVTDQAPDNLVGSVPSMEERTPSVLGVIRVGVPGPCDVRLPRDFLPRELCLACSLLAENVRLRRRQEDGAALLRRLHQETLTDPLTGLPNRRAWDQVFAERTGQALGPSRRRCAAIVDIDLFKQINDRHGYATGDAVLQAAAKALRDGIRADDFVARLGGDEFGLLLTVADSTMAETIVDRARRAIPVALGRADLPPSTASAGLCLLATGPDESLSPAADWLPSAAQALREAKLAGRNRTRTVATD